MLVGLISRHHLGRGAPRHASGQRKGTAGACTRRWGCMHTGERPCLNVTCGQGTTGAFVEPLRELSSCWPVIEVGQASRQRPWGMRSGLDRLSAAEQTHIMLDGHIRNSRGTASSAPGQIGVTDRAILDYLSPHKTLLLTLLSMPGQAGSALSKAAAALDLRWLPPAWLEPVLTTQAQRRDCWPL